MSYVPVSAYGCACGGQRYWVVFSETIYLACVCVYAHMVHVVCTCVSTSVQACTYTCVRVAARSKCWVSSITLHFIIESELLTEPGVHQSGLDRGQRAAGAAQGPATQCCSSRLICRDQLFSGCWRARLRSSRLCSKCFSS